MEENILLQVNDIKGELEKTLAKLDELIMENE